MTEPCAHARAVEYYFQRHGPCSECAAEGHAAWVESVGLKLCAALSAAAAGEPVAWDAWSRGDEPAATGAPGPAWSPSEVLLGIPYEPPAMTPLTIDQIYQLIDDLTPMLVCAPGMFERVRDAVAGSELAGRVRAREHAWLDGDQVFLVDPAALQPPTMAEIFADPDLFKPKFRCTTCMEPTYDPGYCLRCDLLRKAFPPKPIGLGIITGLGL